RSRRSPRTATSGRGCSGRRKESDRPRCECNVRSKPTTPCRKAFPSSAGATYCTSARPRRRRRGRTTDATREKSLPHRESRRSNKATGSRRPDRSGGGTDRRTPPANAPAARERNSAARVRSAGDKVRCSFGSSVRLLLVFLYDLRAESQIMDENADRPEDNPKIPNPFQRPFPQPHRQRDARIFRQSAVQLRILRIVQDIDHVGSAHSGRIIDSRILESGVCAKLLGTCLRQFLHFRLRSKMQAARRAGLDARWFEPHRNAVVAQRALEDFARRRIKFRNVERTAGHAIPATDTICLLEIYDAVGILNDRGVRRAGREAARIGAMHALVFAHEQHHGAVGTLMLIELDQVPVIPCRLGHRLVTVVEGGFAERVTVPFQAGYFARFAANTRGRVDQLANLEFTVQTFTGDDAGVTGDSD